MWPRLLRFPLFWIGALLLALLLVQTSNPSWKWQDNGKIWWMIPVSNVPYIPTSTDTPFAHYNIWRQIIIYSTVWLSISSIWVAITRRKTIHILLGVLVVNAVLLSIEGYIQRLSGTEKLLFVREFPGATSFAVFIYRNHAGAYLGLIVSVAIAVASWHFYEGRRQMARSTPSSVWILAALLLIVAVVFSYSRGAMVASAVFIATAGFAFLLLRKYAPVPSTIPIAVPVAMTLLIIGCFGFVLRSTDMSMVSDRFEQLIELREKEDSYLLRKLVREHASAMLRDHWVRGTGAGSFRFLFPRYIKDDQILYNGGKSYWDHAHMDWLEIPIELGLIGDLLLIAGFSWVIWQWWRMRGWRHPVALMLLLGCCQTLGYALIDFPFQNTAILITWWSLLVFMIRWLEFDMPSTAQKYFQPKIDALR